MPFVANLLSVGLSGGVISRLEVPEVITRQFLYGRGINAWLLAQHIEADCAQTATQPLDGKKGELMRSPLLLTIRLMVLGATLACSLLGCAGEPAAPVVTIDDPPDNSEVTVGEEVLIRSTATHEMGVTIVELWVDDALFTSEISSVAEGESPLSVTLSWTPQVVGSHGIVVKAYDGAGNVGESAPITLTAVEPSQPSPTPAREAIPGGVMSLTLVSPGDVIVAGEVARTTGLAYFLDSAGWLYVLDGASLQVVAKRQVLPSPEEGEPSDLAVDEATGKVYLGNGPHEETLILDSESLSLLGRVDAYGRIEVDPVTHRLYVARVGVYVADGETGEVIDRIEGTIPEEGMEMFSGVPRGVDVHINPATRHLYVMMDNYTPGSNSRQWLDLYDADDYTLLAEHVPVAYGTSGTPDFDSERGVEYVSGYHPIMMGDSRLVALDAQGREVDYLWGVGGDAFFSPRHGLVYVVAGWERLELIDAQTMDYLDSCSVKATLHDPVNGRFYYLGWSQPAITVSDEPSASLGPRAAATESVGPLPTTDFGRIGRLALSPTFLNDQTLFLTMDNSLFASSDGGESWTEITLPFLTRGGMRLILSPAYDSDRTLFLGFSCEPAGDGILRSTDGGLNWTRVNSGLTDLGIEALAFSPNYVQDRTVFAVGCFDGVFKSTDGGTSWRPLTADLLIEEESSERAQQLVISPAFARDQGLWVLTRSSVHRSDDGGESWQRADQGLEGLELRRLVLSSNYEADGTAMVAAGHGIYITRTGGEEWQPLGPPISALWVTDLALSPAFDAEAVLFVAGYDDEYRDRLYRSTDGGQTWLEVGDEFAGQSFEGLVLSPQYAVDNLLLASTDRGGYRSVDGGESWQSLNIPDASSVVLSPGFAIDRTIYASGYALYRSRDGGESWTTLYASAAALPTVTPSPTVAPSPAPAPSPTPFACPGLDPAFLSIAARLESLRRDFTDLPNVGCPTGPAQTISGAWQAFLLQAPASSGPAPPSYMIWRSDSRTIYVVTPADSATGRSQVLVYDDDWSEGMAEIPPSCAGLSPPSGLQIPIRGFGKVWCDHSLHTLIGFGYESEKAADLLVQETERGLYLSVPEAHDFVIDLADGVAFSE